MKMLSVIFSSVIIIALSFNYGVDARKDRVQEKSYCERIREQDPQVSSHSAAFKPFVATVNQYPFMVSIHVMGKFQCGGALYYIDLVLTSVSCLQLLYNNRFYRENPQVLSVRVASNYSDTGGEEFNATEIFFHPAYDPRTLAYNIAIIRLSHKVVSRGYRIPKCLDIYKTRQPLPSNVIIFMLGWDDHSPSEKFPQEKNMNSDNNYLAKRYLPIVGNYFCKDIYGKDKITEPMFCAGTMTHPTGACNHDAGGPAIMDGQLVGIISHGYPVCDTPNKPTVFTHIGHVYEWLERVKSPVNSYTYQKDTREVKRTTCIEISGNEHTQKSVFDTDSDDSDESKKGNDDLKPIGSDKDIHDIEIELEKKSKSKNGSEESKMEESNERINEEAKKTTEAMEEATQVVEETKESTNEATEAEEHVTKAAEEATKTAEEITEATEVATEAVEEATEATEVATEEAEMTKGTEGATEAEEVT